MFSKIRRMMTDNRRRRHRPHMALTATNEDDRDPAGAVIVYLTSTRIETSGPAMASSSRSHGASNRLLSGRRSAVQRPAAAEPRHRRALDQPQMPLDLADSPQ
jgi:hypothetical protein